MTEDNHDTELAPTAAAPTEENSSVAEPTTEIPPATHAAAELAWSLPTDDDDTEPAEVEPRHSRLVWSALVALVAALAGALIFLGTTLFGAGSPKPVASQPTTTADTWPAILATVPPTAEPPSSTVAAAPTTIAPPAPPQTFTAAQDHQLIIRLAGQDDESVMNPALVVNHAHRFCSLVAQGISAGKAQSVVAAQALADNPVGDQIGMQTNRVTAGTASAAVDAEWDTLTTEAMAVYTNCH
jgi:hypothetical protein